MKRIFGLCLILGTIISFSSCVFIKYGEFSYTRVFEDQHIMGLEITKGDTTLSLGKQDNSSSDKEAAKKALEVLSTVLQ